MGTIVVHGGAASIAREDVSLHEGVARRAVERGLDILRHGGSALDAAVEAVVVLEDDPCTNAGLGACLNADGVIELDALAMEGTTLGIGAVALCRDVANPIRLARRLLELPDLNLLAGEGASRWARAAGLLMVDPESLVTESARERFLSARTKALEAPASVTSGGRVSLPGEPADTVGAVACDDRGHTAAAVSTGGVPFKPPGRVGDTPLPGSGGYADDQVGAAVATGVGEGIMRVLLSRAALDFLPRAAGPDAAAAAAVALLAERVGGRGGVILVDRHGRPGLAFNTPQMSHAWGTTDAGVRVVGH